MLFKSNSKNLVIADNTKRIQFRGGIYETSDLAEAKFIRALAAKLPEVQITEVKTDGSKTSK